MKWVKYFFAALGYLAAFCVLMTISTQVIDSFVTGEQIEGFAQFWGIHDIEGTLDLYVDASLIISGLVSVLVILLCRIYIRRYLGSSD
ncbi:hypothetical protein EDF78_101440 [Rahnella sp. BIGb0236]|uniref:hypothetical protein n=1 Tax=Rahnella sp. BIGb0236 TaxID=2485117 RepID=UPI00105B90D5|nr:hypothetical protein [Rahnella sp. BIGb0236]TDS98065.1 hypothetical protein EDF78_101440 [Rahnella sp. BIGb0236]